MLKFWILANLSKGVYEASSFKNWVDVDHTL